MNTPLDRILFLDIETVSGCSTYEVIADRLKPLWHRKAGFIDADREVDELYTERAGIYAEFGKVIVIGLGYLILDHNKKCRLRIKALTGHDEYKLLSDFKNLLEGKFGQSNLKLCAHNGKEFDYPYLCRRMLINGIKPPRVLDIRGKKPWEVPHLDTLELWKFGDRKNYTSLELLAAVFDIPGSKDDMDGSMVNEVYHTTGNLEKIAEYCRKDVSVTAQLYLKLHGLSLIPDHNISFI